MTNGDSAPDVLHHLNELLFQSSTTLRGIIVGRELVIQEESRILEHAVLEQSLTQSANTIARRGQRTDFLQDQTAWGSHLSAIQAHLRDELKNQRVHHKQLTELDPATNERRIRGCTAEFVLQRMLAQTLSNSSPSETDAVLLHRAARIGLPSQDRRSVIPCEYRFHFTTPLNCEIKFNQHIANTHVRHRNRPMQQSTGSLTEVDAVVATDYDESAKQYRRFYLFDATTSDEQYGNKLLTKPTKLEHFIHDMEDRGVDIQVVIVEMASPDVPLRMHRAPKGQGHVSGIVLRPGNIIHEMTKKAAAELHVPIPSY
jgi:hypothetical protein